MTSLVLAAVTASGSALAQPSAENEARALVLFKEAVGALEKGDYAAACPKFEAAMSLYPSPSTELNIAKCFEHDGKVASAWASYQRALVLNRDTTQVRRREALEKMATDGAAALQKRLPSLRVSVQFAAPRTGLPQGLVVSQDGQELPPASLGVALPVDPGDHEIVARAPGYEIAKQSVRAAEGKASDVAIVLRAIEAKAEPPPPGPASATVAARPPDEPPSGKIPVWAWVVGGTGVALGVAAAAFRVQWAHIDAKQESAGCGPDLTSCPRSYTDLDADNATKARDRVLVIGLTTASIVGVGAGIVGIVTGALKKSSASSAPSVSAWIGQDVRGLVVQGAY